MPSVRPVHDLFGARRCGEMPADRPDHQIVIVGAGFSGIGAAIGLDRAGFPDYVILDGGDGVGGAWHWNTYPPSTMPTTFGASPPPTAPNPRPGLEVRVVARASDWRVL